MRRQTRVIVLIAAGVVYLGVATISLLDAATILIVGGSFCDNCSQADIARTEHPLHVVVVVLAATLVAGVSFAWWWLRQPQKPQ